MHDLFGICVNPIIILLHIKVGSIDMNILAYILIDKVVSENRKKATDKKPLGDVKNQR